MCDRRTHPSPAGAAAMQARGACNWWVARRGCDMASRVRALRSLALAGATLESEACAGLAGGYDGPDHNRCSLGALAVQPSGVGRCQHRRQAHRRLRTRGEYRAHAAVVDPRQGPPGAHRGGSAGMGGRGAAGALCARREHRRPLCACHADRCAGARPLGQRPQAVRARAHTHTHVRMTASVRWPSLA